MTDNDLFWLAGILEGEGSFLCSPPSAPNQPRIQLAMCDRDIIERAAKILGVTYIHTEDRRPTVWRPSHTILVKGKKALVIMGLLYPLMGQRRQQQIAKARASYDPHRHHRHHLSEDQIRTILRRCSTTKYRILAQEYNVSLDCIKSLACRKTARWVV